MQTFLPYREFLYTAKSLDMRRLGKQRVEVLQLLKVIRYDIKSTPWYNHPAAQMWIGYDGALQIYGKQICLEWVRRGYRDTCYQKISEIDVLNKTGKPWWLGDENFHSSHRAALLAKDPTHYGQFGWVEEPKIEYLWPTKV